MRQSNFELFRIVSMLLVVLVHCAFVVNGTPNAQVFDKDPYWTGILTVTEALSLVCVNCFVLISGYFGIRQSWKGFFNLLFIIYFWQFGLYGASLIWGDVELSWISFAPVISLFHGPWFIGAYLGLYAVSGILNGFIDNVPQRTFRNALIIYLVMQIGLGWILCPWPNNVVSFNSGYTALSLIGIYMIGRYIAMYNPFDINKWKALGIYFILSICNAIWFLYAMSLHFDKKTWDKFTNFFSSYDSVFIIFGSVMLMHFFSKLKFQSRIINSLASSAFAVYLIHFNPFIFPYFKSFALAIKSAVPLWLWLPSMILYCIAIYLVCYILDRPRYYIWRCLSKLKVRLSS